MTATEVRIGSCREDTWMKTQLLLYCKKFTSKHSNLFA